MKLLAIIFALFLSNAHAQTSFPAAPYGQTGYYSVVNVFDDYVTFRAPVAGLYSATVVGLTQNGGCPRYTVCGKFIATITSVQLQDAMGTAILDFTSPWTSSYVIPAGNYRLRVQGLGQGTLSRQGRGNFSVSMTAPAAAAPVPSCDYVRDILQTFGYTEAQIEVSVSALKAKVPSGCAGD